MDPKLATGKKKAVEVIKMKENDFILKHPGIFIQQKLLSVFICHFVLRKKFYMKKSITVQQKFI